MTFLRKICVFCGSNLGANSEFKTAAAELGALLANQKIGVVYGGAGVGLMGALADAALAAGGEVIGVIPQNLMVREVAHKGLKDLRVVRSMHERKAMMESLSDGFIALPGGFGTFEEFFEIVTWGQLGLHSKPVGLLDVGNYYAPLLTLVDNAVKAGFIPRQHQGIFVSDSTPNGLLTKLRNRPPIAVPKWMQSKSQT